MYYAIVDVCMCTLLFPLCSLTFCFCTQIKFSPRRQRGYALTDGEGIERLWSYLRGFSSMTKEMSSGRRTDMLIDALLHYSSRQLLACGNFRIYVSSAYFA